MSDRPEPTFVNTRTVRVAWGDCDPAQIVFFPRYYEMFDAATQELFRAALGAPKIAWVKTYGIVGIPLVETRAKYFIPSYYGDDIVIESRVSAFRRTSFDVVHRILKDGALAVEGFEARVWAAANPSRPGGIASHPIPDEVVRAFAR
ncbi:MAG: acyl-CoA thioesterase [Gammaproteobacteria bacterium]|nr:acyl-CoA thioesterase [Gammaproteobacteria bacterium]